MAKCTVPINNEARAGHSDLLHRLAFSIVASSLTGCPRRTVAESPQDRLPRSLYRMLPKPTVGVVLALALPVLAQYGLSQVVLLSDSVIAGRLEDGSRSGAAIQAAQTNTHYLSWAVTSYAILVTVGSTALVARFVGAGDISLARDATHQSLLLGVIFAGLATAAGLAWRHRCACPCAERERRLGPVGRRFPARPVRAARLSVARTGRRRLPDRRRRHAHRTPRDDRRRHGKRPACLGLRIRLRRTPRARLRRHRAGHRPQPRPRLPAVVLCCWLAADMA